MKKCYYVIWNQICICASQNHIVRCSDCFQINFVNLFWFSSKTLKAIKHLWTSKKIYVSRIREEEPNSFWVVSHSFELGNSLEVFQYVFIWAFTHLYFIIILYPNKSRNIFIQLAFIDFNLNFRSESQIRLLLKTQIHRLNHWNIDRFFIHSMPESTKRPLFGNSSDMNFDNKKNNSIERRNVTRNEKLLQINVWCIRVVHVRKFFVLNKCW